jgi:hypothetical protein
MGLFSGILGPQKFRPYCYRVVLRNGRSIFVRGFGLMEKMDIFTRGKCNSWHRVSEGFGFFLSDVMCISVISEEDFRYAIYGEEEVNEDGNDNR